MQYEIARLLLTHDKRVDLPIESLNLHNPCSIEHLHSTAEHSGVHGTELLDISLSRRILTASMWRQEREWLSFLEVCRLISRQVGVAVQGELANT